MRTRQKYIYDYETNYLVRFRDEKGRYIQKAFGYASKSKKEVLAKAIKWRNENLPDIRKTGKRMLQSKPQRNKKNKLPAGISLSFKYKDTRNKKYKYPILSISAGKDEKGKALIKTIRINNYANRDAAIEAAIRIRVNLLIENNKTELQRFENKKG